MENPPELALEFDGPPELLPMGSEDEYSNDDEELTFDTSDIAFTTPPKTYRGKPCRTMLLSVDRRRVPTLKRRREVPNIGKQQQSRDGRVKAFTPKPFGQCCKRRCCKHLVDPEDHYLQLAREPLYDSSLTRAAMRHLLQTNAITLLINPEDGLAVCNKMACIAFSCSTSFLNPNTKRTRGTQGDSNHRRANSLFAVMAWFENEKELCDVMPDTGKYLLSYPKKVAVWERYMSDVDEMTRCSTCELGRSGHAGPCGCPHAQKVYVKVSESYFYEIWAKYHLNCQIRKHMRFSKCCFCVKMRSVRNNRTQSEHARQVAKDRLTGHYDWIARERAEEVQKVGTHTPIVSFRCVFFLLFVFISIYHSLL